jgi:hypothetical protein
VKTRRATDGTVTDGPYRETKEHIGGFAVVDVSSRLCAAKEDAGWRYGLRRGIRDG